MHRVDAGLIAAFEGSVDGDQSSLHAAPLPARGRGRSRKAEYCQRKEEQMSRPRQRVCLQDDGLKLDLNRLIRRGTVRPGTRTGPYLIQWTNSYTGELVASGEITANLCVHEEGWFRFQASGLDQWITLIPRPRYYGGRQWYFHLPSNAPASICALDAPWRRPILQPSNLGKAGGRLSIAILRPG
jgi:hypothetical protein